MAGSRWEGYQTPSPMMTSGGNAQFDAIGNPSSQQRYMEASSFVRSGLVEWRINTIDPSFYDCLYSVAGSANTVIERCYKDIGCCPDGCCRNSYWHNRYGWAVALIVVFCCLVIFSCACWLLFWLFNRAKDKQQKRQLYYENYDETFSGLPTPQPTPTQYAPQEQYSYDPARDRDNYRY